MAIEKRYYSKCKPKYIVSIWHRGKKYATASFSKLIDAEKWEAEKKYFLESGKNFPDFSEDITFKQLFELWLKAYAEKNKSPNSLQKDKQMYRDYLQPVFANKLTSVIRPDDLDKLIDNLSCNTALANSSINKILELARTLFNFAVSRRHIKYSPMLPIKMLPVYEQAFDYWSFEEASKFLSFANEKYFDDKRWIYVFFLLGLKTGLRLGEIMALNWNSVLFDQSLLRVSATYDKTLKDIKQTTKSKKIRFVGLDENLKCELYNLKKGRSTGLVFINKVGKCLNQENLRKRHFNKDIKASGVRKIRIHDLRHTFASHFVMNGGNIHDLQLILGHSDVKTTMRYAHLSPQHIASKASIVSFNTNLLKPSNIVQLKSNNL